MDADVLLDVAELDAERRRLSREHPARPRMKADSVCRSSERELRREIGGALLGPDQLHAIAKTRAARQRKHASSPSNRRRTFTRRPQGHRKTTSRRRWNGTSDRPTAKECSPNRTGRDLGFGADLAEARMRAAKTPGSSNELFIVTSIEAIDDVQILKAFHDCFSGNPQGINYVTFEVQNRGADNITTRIMRAGRYRARSRTRSHSEGVIMNNI